MNIQLSTSSKAPIYRQIADAIAKEVQSGQIGLGDKLPPQMELAQSLGVNALTVRRGYELLESQGIIKQRRGAGTYVEIGALQKIQLTPRGTHGSYMNNLFTAHAKHRIKAAYAGTLEAATIIGNGYDPNVIGGRENRLPSDTGGVSYVPPLMINDKRM